MTAVILLLAVVQFFMRDIDDSSNVDELPETTLDELEEKSEVHRLDENRAIVSTGDGKELSDTVEHGDVALTVELTTSDGRSHNTSLSADSHKEALKAFVAWYAALTSDDTSEELVEDIFE